MDGKISQEDFDAFTQSHLDGLNEVLKSKPEGLVPILGVLHGPLNEGPPPWPNGPEFEMAFLMFAGDLPEDGDKHKLFEDLGRQLYAKKMLVQAVSFSSVTAEAYDQVSDCVWTDVRVKVIDTVQRPAGDIPMQIKNEIRECITKLSATSETTSETKPTKE